MDIPGLAIAYLLEFVGALMVESLLYGAHCILFGIAAYYLWPQEAKPRLILFVAIFILFSLATADIALSYRFVLRDLPAVTRGAMILQHAVARLLKKNVLLVSSNLLADSLLIYRLYMVWNQKKRIIVLPVLLLLAETVWGYLSQLKLDVATISRVFTPVYFWNVFAYNITMTLLTAGRIWWVAYRAQPFLVPPSQRKRINTAIAILVESGAIYSISILLVLSIGPGGDGWRFFVLVLPYRLVGVMPTLMVVQVEVFRNTKRTRRTPTAPSAVMSTIPSESIA